MHHDNFFSLTLALEFSYFEYSYLTTCIEDAPDLKKSVESSITATLLKIPFQIA